MDKLGRYEILEELGHGAMGVVYKAKDPKIDRIVALKTILAQGLGPKEQEEFRERFFREARAAGKLSHPGIVTIYDVGEDEATQTPYLVMEFITGRTLDSILQAGEGLTLEKTIDLVGQIAEALGHAHAQGIVHRDIKPANILLTEEGRAKITDFGIARFAASQFTQAGQMLGTPSYMSPEQLSGGQVDGRSDIFSLGVILYLLLTGDKPFSGETITSLSFKIVYTDPIPPRQLNVALSEEFNYIVARALAKDPAARYRDCRELIDDLEDVKQGRPPRSKAAQPPAAAMAERTVVRAPAGQTVVAKTAPTVSPPAAVATAAPAPVAVQEGFWQRLTPKQWLIAGAAVLVVAVSLGGFLLTRKTSEPATGPAPRQESAPAQPVPRRSATRASSSAAAIPAGEAATLIVDCRHNLRSGTIAVFCDGRRIHEGRLRGQVQDLKFVRVVQGTYSAALAVPAGSHTIRVQISSSEEGFNQSAEAAGSFRVRGTRTLEVGLGEGSGFGVVARNLTLRWR